MIRALFAFVLLIVSVSVFSQASKGDIAYQEGKDLLDKGEQDNAIKSFYNARAAYLSEKNYHRYFVATQALAVIFGDTGDGASADNVLTEALHTIPQRSADDFELHAKLYDNLAYNFMYVMNKTEKARDAYAQCIGYYEKAGKSGSKDIAFELNNRAIVSYALSDFHSAVDDLLNAIAIYEKDAETPAADLATYYLSLGENYSALEEFDKGKAALEKGLTLAKAAEFSELEAKFYLTSGNLYNTWGDHAHALEQYEKSNVINEALFGKDAIHYAPGLINSGNALKDIGDWQGALLQYQEVLTIYQKTPPDDLSNFSDLLLNISRTMSDLGLAEQAEAVLQQALTFTTTSIGKNSIEEADIYAGMAAQAFNRGEFDQSLNHNFKALSILDANHYPDNGYRAELFNTIGQGYDELGDVALALKYKTQSLDIYRSVYGAEHASTGMQIGNMARSYEVAEKYDEALNHLQRSLAVLTKALPAAHENIGITYLDMGVMYLNKNQPEKAVESLDKAYVIFKTSSKNVNRAKICNRLGEAWFLLNDRTKAERYFQEAIVANTFNFDQLNFEALPEKPEYIKHYELVASYIGKADLFRARGDLASLAKAQQHLDAADALLASKATDLTNPKDRLELAQLNAFFTESGLLLAQRAYALIQHAKYLEKAFYYSERSKANELLADIQQTRAASLSRIPKKTLTRRKALAGRLTNLQQQIASAHAAQKQSLIAQLKGQELDLQQEYDKLQQEIVNASPKLSAVINQRTLPAWNDVKKALGPNAVIVSYSITDSAKFILVGNATSLTMKVIPPQTNLDKLVRGYINHVKFQGPSLAQLRDQLTELLWLPVEASLATLGTSPVNEIIILADGPLAYLPFESLGKDRFLIEKYTLRYHFSGALLLEGAKPRVKNKPSFIALAPVFEDEKTNFVNKSCERFVASAQKTDSASRAFTLNGDYISPLPATRAEVQQINRMHASKGVFTKFFIEAAAREELIKKGELDHFDYIHFATHGFVNAQYPELSGLLLTQDAKSSEDGILYTGEILGLNLDADLVTLSACETALGKKIQGEGVRGLTTSFLFAGARNVVASLWKVADESTSQLMIAFYNELLTGKDKASALRAARLSLLRDERYHHPYYWAPFIQIGAN